jgi:ABC-type Na+ efflux pump permease subunit
MPASPRLARAALALGLALTSSCTAAGYGAYFGGAAVAGAGLGYADSTPETRDHDTGRGALIGLAVAAGLYVAGLGGAALGKHLGDAFAGGMR